MAEVIGPCRGCLQSSLRLFPFLLVAGNDAIHAGGGGWDCGPLSEFR